MAWLREQKQNLPYLLTFKFIIMSEIKNSKQSAIAGVSGSFFRPKNGHELLHAMKNNIRCEIVDTHAFTGAQMLEENLGASFSFKLSEVNKGWTLFKRS